MLMNMFFRDRHRHVGPRKAPLIINVAPTTRPEGLKHPQAYLTTSVNSGVGASLLSPGEVCFERGKRPCLAMAVCRMLRTNY